MSWLRRIRNLFRSDRHSRDLDRELQFHIAERADELAAAGMDRASAEREARRRFGNYAGQKERARDADIITWLGSFADDVRYAIRSMRHNRVLSLVAILSLGLGIGANAAIFTLIDAVMLRALPVSHPDELVHVELGDGGNVFTNPIWEQVRDHQTGFRSLFAYASTEFNLVATGEARPALGSFVSGGFFPGLGVYSAAGRVLGPADDYRGCPPVAVLSYGFWQSEYGGDASIVGRTVQLSAHPFTVVGVAASGFSGIRVGSATQIFAPLCSEAVLRGARSSLDRRSTWWIRVMGRERLGLTDAQVVAGLNAIAPGVFEATLPQGWDTKGQADYLKTRFSTEPAARGFSGLRVYQAPLIALMVIAGLVLLIACANVANLLLARAAARQREMAVRVAIGAGRSRIVRQLLTESVALSTAGAVLGLVMARWGSRALVAFLSSQETPIFLDLSLDRRMLAFGIGIAVVTGLAFGLVPAWRAARVAPSGALKTGGRATLEGGGRGRLSLNRALVVAQLAVSLTLVVGAGLLLGTFRKLESVDLGFQPANVLLAGINQPGARSNEALIALHRETLDRLRAVPGVASASLSNLTPVGSSEWNDVLLVPGRTAKSQDDQLAWFNSVSDGYFSTTGTPIIAGRDFNDADRPTSQLVAIVNQAMAAKFFTTRDVLGRQFTVKQGNGQRRPIEIVGLVANAKYESLREDPQPTVYLSIGQDSVLSTRVSVELRATGAAASIEPAVKAALAEIEPHTAESFITFSTQIADRMKQEQLLAVLSSLFGGLALLLARLGLYGIVAYGVARRRGEFGIRMALGAGQRRVAGMVMGEVSVMVVIGVAVGIGLAAGTTRLLASLLFGLDATNPAIFAGATAVLAVVALVAAYVPARRASRIDPMEALREE